MSNEQLIIEKLEAIQKENAELKELINQVIEKQHQPVTVRAEPKVYKINYDED